MFYVRGKANGRDRTNQISQAMDHGAWGKPLGRIPRMGIQASTKWGQAT